MSTKGEKVKAKAITVPILGVGLAVGLAACGSSTTPSSSKASAPASASASSGAAAGTSGKDFGPGCSSVPKSGKGSFSGMATAPVATAASHNPLLSTLVTAVKKAGLVSTLNSEKNITVFAPDNAAFKKIPSKELNMVLANKKALISLLTYHVAAGRVTPAELASGKPIKSVEGAYIKPSYSSGTYSVDGQPVVCGNVQTANATVYIIGGVMTDVLANPTSTHPYESSSPMPSSSKS